jgi:hypothetical protein
VVEIPLFVHFEYETESRAGEKKAYGKQEAKERREVAFWGVGLGPRCGLKDYVAFVYHDCKEKR